MTLTDNPLLLFSMIIGGVIAQQFLTWLKQHNKKTAYTIIRPMVLVYWIAFGLGMAIGGVAQLRQGDLLTGIGGLALGMGLMVSGLGQALERVWLRTIGVVMLSIGPVVAGVGFMMSGSPLNGMIALAMGLGILASAVQGWVGGVGQMVIGAVILGSSVMLLIGIFMMNTLSMDFAMAGIGVVMLGLGLWSVISGGMAVMGSLRRLSGQGSSMS
jgi:hypothetical protein